ncbi:nucleotidyltransferase family protein [Roseibium sp. RKSG952]|uniref:nucleotidyltransferase family protein n=1 Tax=Roseibium sp. RKSG952 TaxID=2529384 RepID=UPI001FCAA000|nr:nucleotidyltransferase family protein [Roseibium sp. RKSG952]
MATETERETRLREIIRTAPHLIKILKKIRDLGLPDAWLVSGGLYQTVWNALTRRDLMNGIKDFDIIYFDGKDLSYDGEDKVIRAVAAALPDLASVLEVRNQARVHLWYENRFGTPYRPLTCSIESLTNYAAKTHAVAVRLTDEDRLEIRAPFGLANIFALRLVPNLMKDNAQTYTEKAARMMQYWPELTVEPWPEKFSGTD